MGAAAGAAVRAGKGDDAHLSRQLLFGAVVHGFQLRRGRVGDLNGMVVVDVLVGFGFQRHNLLVRKGTVEVDGARRSVVAYDRTAGTSQ